MLSVLSSQAQHLRSAVILQLKLRMNPYPLPPTYVAGDSHDRGRSLISVSVEFEKHMHLW